MARSESLSSTRRIGTRLSDPARGHAGLSGFFLEVGDRLLLRLDLALDAFLLGEGALAFELDLGTLCWIVAGSEVGPERVDLALQRVGVHLAALEGQPRVGH